jgi:phosphate starvation-inducible PhoH-like protein
MNNQIEIPLPAQLMPLFLGPNDSHLRLLEEYFRTTIIVREASLVFDSSLLELENVLNELVSICGKRGYLEIKDIETAIRVHRIKSDNGRNANGISVLENPQIIIKSRSFNQASYVKAMEENELVFCIGPAGTGKTFLAVAWAVSMLERKAVERIILVKPAVEAGEKLGFLPGDIKEKVDPYFRPLYDALLMMMPADRLRKYIDQSIIEIAPLAFMRGRTLNYAITILDEAQNTTPMQMKMFLTRMGSHSRAVVTGDLTQIDLEKPESSGLLKIQKILSNIKGIQFVYLDSSDVIRHRLVSDIIKAYDKFRSEDEA